MADDVESFARATRRSRNIKLGVLGLVVLSPLIWVGYKNFAKRAEIEERREEHRKAIALSAEEKAALKAAIPATRKAIEDAASAFSTTVTPAVLESLEDAGGACPYRVSAPSMGAGDSYVKHGSIDMNYFGNASFRFYRPGQPIEPTVGADLWVLDEIVRELGNDTADKYDLDRVHALSRLDHELFVVGERTDPVVLADSYLPGTISGFAYLYSYQARRVVCFTALAVQSSEQIEIRYSHMEGNFLDEHAKKGEAARAILERDLEVQTRYAIAARLRAVL